MAAILLWYIVIKFIEKSDRIFIKIDISKGPINSISSLIQLMVGWRRGIKPLMINQYWRIYAS